MLNSLVARPEKARYAPDGFIAQMNRASAIGRCLFIWGNINALVNIQSLSRAQLQPIAFFHLERLLLNIQRIRGSILI